MILKKKIRYLDRYRNSMNKYESLKRQESFIYDKIHSSKTSILSFGSKGNNHADLSDGIVKLEKILTEVREEESKSLNVCAEIEELIKNIPDGRDSEIMHMRHIELKPWQEIADHVGYDRPSVCRIHRKALERLTIL